MVAEGPGPDLGCSQESGATKGQREQKQGQALGKERTQVASLSNSAESPGHRPRERAVLSLRPRTPRPTARLLCSGRPPPSFPSRRVSEPFFHFHPSCVFYKYFSILSS